MVRVRTAMLLMSFLAASDSSAQYFGRWSWDAQLRLAQRSYETTRGGGSASTFGEDGLWAGLGLSGFVVHPAVAEFRLAFEALLSRYRGALDEGARQPWDSRRGLGWNGDLRVFPRGAIAFRAYSSQSRFSYAEVVDEDPLTLRGQPETVTKWGARIQARQGPFRGLLAGIESTDLSFVDPSAETETQERAFLDWARGGSHHYRLEMRRVDYGAIDYESETLTGTVEEHRDIASAWRWDLSGALYRNHHDYRDAGPVDLDSLHLSNTLVKTFDGDRRLSISYDAGAGWGGSATPSQSHTLVSRYQWPLDGWSLLPYIGIGTQEAGDASTRSPFGGTTVLWTRNLRLLTLSASGSVGAVMLTYQAPGYDESSTTLTYLLDASAGLGAEETLRAQLELHYSANQLRRAGEAIAGYSELGAALAGVGTEDRTRSRLALTRKRGKVRIRGTSEWLRLQSDTNAFFTGFDSTTMMGTLEIGIPRLSLTASGGRTTVAGLIRKQEVDYLMAGASFQPWSFVSLRASHRTDRRSLAFGPPLDGNRTEAGLDLYVGAFVVQALAFEVVDNLVENDERQDRGLQWSVSRSFGGWLPIVTAPERRGDIQ